MKKKALVTICVIFIFLVLGIISVLTSNFTTKLPTNRSIVVPTPTPDPYTVNGTKKIYVDDKAPYSITANKDSSYYKILITKSPFQQYRLEAEQKFLEQLNITKEKACGLDVEITTPRFANPDQAGQIYKLSFCQ